MKVRKFLLILFITSIPNFISLSAGAECDPEKEDLALLYQGGGGPPNIMWFIDSSGSMRGLACEGNCDLEPVAGEPSCGVYQNTTPNFFRNLGYNPQKLYPVFYPQCGDYGGNGVCYNPCHVYRRNTNASGSCSGTWWSDVGDVNQFCTDGSTASCAPSAGWVCSLNNQSYSTEVLCQSNCAGYVCSYDNQFYPTQAQCVNSCYVSGTCTRKRVGGQWRWCCDLDQQCYSNETQCNNNCRQNFPCNPQTGTCTYSSQPYSYSGTCARYLFERGYIYCDTNMAGISNCENYGSSRYFFIGNLLNFYPPKYVIARKVFRDLIGYTRRIRQGLMTFDLSNSSSGAYVRWNLNPACNQLESDSSFDSNRQSLWNKLDSMSYTDFNTWTPLGEALMNIGQYFACDGVYSSYYGYQIKNTGLGQSNQCQTTTVSRAFCYKCQKSYAVIVTDGLPTQDCNEFSSGGDRDGDGNSQDSTNHCLDDVSYLLHTLIDLKPDNYGSGYSSCYPGSQNLTVYTVSFGLGQYIPDVLRTAATNGGGAFYNADNYEELVDALFSILLDIIKRSMSFTRASVEAIQTDEYTSGVIARLKPSDYPIWQGFLYRFQLFNEYLAKEDRNGDGDEEDIILLDRDGDIIETNPDGDFVKKGSNVFAVPFWEAGERLALMGPSQRNIYTSIDSNNDGIIDGMDGKIEFSSTNASQILPYLRLDEPFENYPDACSYISDKLNTSLSYLECARYLIDFVRGVDVFDWNNNGSRTDMRPNILGDIFHSSPIEVKSPHIVFYPTIHRQVYDGTVAPQAPELSFCDPNIECRCGIPGLWKLPGKGTSSDTISAFFNYVRDTSLLNEGKSIILTGSNDGIFHAFDAETGDERWAFIPPHLLPRLKELMSTHCYLLDNNPWVREIWHDENGDGIKQSGEFHIVTVVPQRRGGNHWFALDITNFSDPRFLWVFPRSIRELEGVVLHTTPEDINDEAKTGETWGENIPLCPPMNNIAVLDNSGNKIDHYVTFLNAGLYPHEFTLPSNIGRGLFMVNTYTGKKMWEFYYDPVDPVKRYLTYSVVGTINAQDEKIFSQVAPVGLPCGLSDCFFDHLFFGDTGGNLWMVSISSPAQLDGEGRVTNTDWKGVRFFKTSTGQPFYYMPNVYISNDRIYDTRAYYHLFTGTGNRMELSSCDNPPAGINNRIFNLKLPNDFIQFLNINIENLSALPYSENLYFGFPLASTSDAEIKNGWYYDLNPAEKIVYPGMGVLDKSKQKIFLLFTSYLPTTCAGGGGGGGGGSSCEDLNLKYCGGGTKTGLSLLYLLDAISGKGGFPNNQASAVVGKGVPTPPNLIKAIGTGGFSVSILAQGSEGVPSSTQISETTQLFSVFYLLNLYSRPWLHEIRHGGYRIPAIP